MSVDRGLKNNKLNTTDELIHNILFLVSSYVGIISREREREKDYQTANKEKERTVIEEVTLRQI